MLGTRIIDLGWIKCCLINSCFLFSLFQNVYPLFLKQFTSYIYYNCKTEIWLQVCMLLCVHQKKKLCIINISRKWCHCNISFEKELTIKVYHSKWLNILFSIQSNSMSECITFDRYIGIGWMESERQIFWVLILICICSDKNIIGETQKNSSFAWLNCKKTHNCARHTSTFYKILLNLDQCSHNAINNCE